MVRAWVLRKPEKIERLVRKLAPLFDWRGEALSPGRFWQEGTYFTHPARAKAAVIVLCPGRPADPVALGRKAAGVLEKRHGLVLDWAAGARGSGVWVVVKTLAADAETGKNREFRLDKGDLAALRELVPKRCRGRERGRETETRERRRER